MRKFKIEGGEVFFSFPFSKDLNQKFKRVPGARWNGELRMWIAPIIKGSEEKMLDFIDDNNFIEHEEQYEDAEQNLNFTESEMSELKGKLSMLDLCFQPRDYQLETIAYTLDKRNVLNALQMGCGKSFCSVLAVELDKAFPCLVITPASIKHQFANEWKRYTGRTSISVIESKETKSRKNDWNADVVVINYDILAKLVDNGRVGKSTGKPLKDLEMRFLELTGREWKSVVVDEAHFCKNPKAARSKGVAKIMQNSSIQLRQLLTGTPSGGKPKDLINLFKLIGVFEDVFGSYNRYVYRYCNAKAGFGGSLDISGSSNLVELNQVMRDNCYIRYEIEDVIDELPDKIETILDTPLSNQKLYNSAKSDIFSHIVKEKGTESAFKALNAEVLVQLSTLFKLSIEGKKKAIIQYLKDWKECGRKLVVFGESRDVLKSLAEIFQCDVIQGGISSEEKFHIVNKFKESEDIFLFINMKAGSVGIDGIQEVCSNVLVVELPWNPDTLDQAIARIRRMGQKSTVDVRMMLNMNGIDGWKWNDIIVPKKAGADTINIGSLLKEEDILNESVSISLIDYLR